MSDNITTSRWFARQEIDLMKQCLEAIISCRYIDEEEVSIITGWDISEFQELLERFDVVRYEERSLTQKDFGMMFQAVHGLSGYPIIRPRELELKLGISILSLSWFLCRLRPIRDEWGRHVKDDVKQTRLAANIPL